MIKVKEAVRIAFSLLEELYDTKKFEDILLEEVSLKEERAVWLVTIGFSRRAPSENIMEAVGSKKYLRSFKSFEISKETGEMLAMRERG
jgi:hypothetical protein